MFFILFHQLNLGVSAVSVKATICFNRSQKNQLGKPRPLARTRDEAIQKRTQCGQRLKTRTRCQTLTQIVTYSTYGLSLQWSLRVVLYQFFDFAPVLHIVWEHY